MHIERRRLTARDTDHEVLWLSVGVALALLAGAAAWGVVDWPHLVCPFKAATGWPCPTCGATRAVFALARGEMAAALSMNPAAVVLVVLYAIFACYAAATLVLDLPRVRVRLASGDLVPARWTLGLATLGTWGYLLAAGR
jgi:hypothetical protein